jgi:hypothetical protein
MTEREAIISNIRFLLHSVPNQEKARLHSAFNQLIENKKEALYEDCPCQEEMSFDCGQEYMLDTLTTDLKDIFE